MGASPQTKPQPTRRSSSQAVVASDPKQPRIQGLGSIEDFAKEFKMNKGQRSLMASPQYNP